MSQTVKVTNEELAAIPFHERVRHVRKDILGLTQEKFAPLFGVDVRTVKGWENPRDTRGAPNLENAKKLAQLGGYAAVLFITPQPFEVTIAEEISRKLDLLLRHFGLTRDGETLDETFRRLELAGSGRDGRDVPRTGEGSS